MGDGALAKRSPASSTPDTLPRAVWMPSTAWRTTKLSRPLAPPKQPVYRSVQSLNNSIVVGSNCLKEGIDAIKSGKLYSSVTQIPSDLGVKTADTVNDYFSGKKLPKQVLLPMELITKDNVAQWEAEVHLLRRS